MVGSTPGCCPSSRWTDLSTLCPIWDTYLYCTLLGYIDHSDIYHGYLNGTCKLLTNKTLPQITISIIPKYSSKQTLFFSVWHQFYKYISRVCINVFFFYAHYSSRKYFTSNLVFYCVVLLVESRFRVDRILYRDSFMLNTFEVPLMGTPKHFNFILRSDTKYLPIRVCD